MCLCHALTCLQFGISEGRQGWPVTVSWLVILGNFLQLITSALITCSELWASLTGMSTSCTQRGTRRKFSASYHISTRRVGTGRAGGHGDDWISNIIIFELWSSTSCLPQGSTECMWAAVRSHGGCAQLVYLWMFGCKLLLVFSSLISWMRTSK